MFYSQWAQDKWVAEFFKYKRNGYFLDIGAFDGIQLSNTYYLEKELSWTGILIEPNPIEFAKLKSIRTSHAEQVCITPTEGAFDFIVNNVFSAIDADFTDEVAKGWTPHQQSRTTVLGYRLETILKKYNAPATIDFMSLDIEGGEFVILETFPFDQYTFKTMIIEHNAHYSDSNKIKQQKVRSLLESKGYKYHHSHEADDYFTKE